MKDRLLKNLIQDVPEELSVCEFECRKSICTTSDCADCERYQQALKGIHGISQCNSHMQGQEPSTRWQPIWLYEVMPFIYLLAGFTVFYRYDSFVGYGVGSLLLIAAIIIWAMRIKYRAMNTLSPDKPRFPPHSGHS